MVHIEEVICDNCAPRHYAAANLVCSCGRVLRGLRGELDTDVVMCDKCYGQSVASMLRGSRLPSSFVLVCRECKRRMTHNVK